MTATRVFTLEPPDAGPDDLAELVAYAKPITGSFCVLAAGPRADLEPAYRALVDMSNAATAPDDERVGTRWTHRRATKESHVPRSS